MIDINYIRPFFYVKNLDSMDHNYELCGEWTDSYVVHLLCGDEDVDV